MWYQLTSFLKYHLNTAFSNYETSVKRIEFQTLCLNKKVSENELKRFYTYKDDLLQNATVIKVTDFGAGSRVFKSNYRPVQKIAKVAGISNSKAKDLINSCNYLQPKKILEIGTSLGLGSFAMHLGAPTAKIITTEGCPNTAKVAKTQLEKHLANKVAIVVGNFKDTLPTLFKEHNFDLIYFDGNHSKEATETYFNWAVERCKSGTVFIFDDIHWSKEMHRAWIKIQKHSKVATVVTTYNWGILFF